jgi:predicted  nucleic acid-binding Zn-ribbon protein
LGETAAALYALQQIDTRIAQVERALAALDDGTALQAELQDLQTSAESEAAALHSLEQQLLDAELQVKSFEEKKAGYEGRMYSGAVSNPKELADMQREVDMLKRSIGGLEDKALDLMDQVESHRASAAEARAAAERTRQRLAEVLDTFQRESVRCRSELDGLATRREQAVAAVPSEALRRYEELRQRKGNLAVAVASGGLCQACHVSLPTDLVRELKRSNQIQVCDNCGRILHLADE